MTFLVSKKSFQLIYRVGFPISALLVALLCAWLVHDGKSASRSTMASAITASAASTLELTAARVGGQFRVSWKGYAQEVVGSSGAILSISDGNERTEIHLAPEQLRGGWFLYDPASRDIRLRLDLQPAGRAPVTESLRILAAAAPKRNAMELNEQAESGESDALRSAPSRKRSIIIREAPFRSASVAPDSRAEQPAESKTTLAKLGSKAVHLWPFHPKKRQHPAP